MLASLGGWGVIPFGIASLLSGAMFFLWAALTGKLRGKGAGFWRLSVGLGAANAVGNGAFAFVIASKSVPVGMLTSIALCGAFTVQLAKGRKAGAKRIVPILLTGGGLVMFLVTGWGHVEPVGLLIAFAAAAAQGLSVFLFQRAAVGKQGPESQAITQPVAGALLLAGACIASVITGHGFGGGRWMDGGLLLRIGFLSVVWALIPTLLNVAAATMLEKKSESAYPALQLLSAPISMPVQIWVMRQAMAVWSIIANLMIFIGGLLAVMRSTSPTQAAEAVPSAAEAKATAPVSEGGEGLTKLDPDGGDEFKKQFGDQVEARFGVSTAAAVWAALDRWKRRSRGGKEAASVYEATQKTGTGDDENTHP
ncbi:hypothetical protein [Actinoallomurus sp. NPDC052274]|uniref:hypothetical protein n=1 Tax=Actinoallomurus sp. NPDC052274 TaxID=3155420 RepID=UPI0034265BD3